MQVGKRIFSALWNGAKLPCPAWAVGLALALSVASASAAVGTLYGSLNVPTSGTITDNNASVNSCVNTNGSKQYTYTSGVCLTQNGGQTVTSGDTFNSTTTLAGLDLPATGTASSGTQHFTSYNSEFDESDWNGSSAVTNSWVFCAECSALNQGEFTIQYDNAINAVFESIGSVPFTQLLLEEGQLQAAVPSNVDEVGLLVNAQDVSGSHDLADIQGGNTTNGTGGLQFSVASNGASNIFSKPTSACQTNAPIASFCIGSPTPTIAAAIGKVTGGWGGTTASNSGQLCFIINNGSGDLTNRCINATSAGTITFNGQSVQTGPLTVSKLTQSATGDVWGSCAMSASTSCTITWSYTPTFCGSPNPLGTTVINGVASISSTTITITAASSNSQTWDVTCS